MIKEMNKYISLKRTMKFLQIRRPTEILAASVVLSFLLISCLSYYSSNGYNNAGSTPRQSFAPQPSNSEITIFVGGGGGGSDTAEQPNSKTSKLKEFCGDEEEACQSQEHPKLIQWIRQVWLQDLHDPQQPLNFKNPPVDRGQIGVPLFIDRLLDYKKNGFFIECGAWDGEELSNTILFERKRQWKGLLIEPNVEGFASLRTKKQKRDFVQHLFVHTKETTRN